MDLGSKGKYFQGAKLLSFRELGRSMHYFQGSREHRPPPPPGGPRYCRYLVGVIHSDTGFYTCVMSSLYPAIGEQTIYGSGTRQ